MNIFQLIFTIQMIYGLIAGQPHVNIMNTIDTLKHMTENELLQEFQLTDQFLWNIQIKYQNQEEIDQNVF